MDRPFARQRPVALVGFPYNGLQGHGAEIAAVEGIVDVVAEKEHVPVRDGQGAALRSPRAIRHRRWRGQNVSHAAEGFLAQPLAVHPYAVRANLDRLTGKGGNAV